MKNNRVFAACFCFFVILVAISCSTLQPTENPPQPTPKPAENIPTDAEPNTPADSSGSVPVENPTAAISNASDASFSVESANPVPPDDILNEINFYGGGGEPMCGFKPDAPASRSNDKQVDQDLMTLYTLIVCGWEKDEVVTGTVTYPDGRIITQAIPLEVEPLKFDENAQLIDGIYYGKLGFKPTLDDPAGTYFYKMEGPSGAVQFGVNFHKPKGPRLFIADMRQILFHGFSPNEKVRLLYYQDNQGAQADLKGWQEYTMNSSGQLYVETNVDLIEKTTLVHDPYGYFVALGKARSETWLPIEDNVFGRTKYPLQATSKVNQRFCPGKPSRLTILMSAKVTYTDGKNLSIHSRPGISKKVTGSIPEGTEISILEGPQCADKLTWWNIRYGNNSAGWVAEVSPEGVYLLEP